MLQYNMLPSRWILLRLMRKRQKRRKAGMRKKNKKIKFCANISAGLKTQRCVDQQYIVIFRSTCSLQQHSLVSAETFSVFSVNNVWREKVGKKAVQNPI